MGFVHAEEGCPMRNFHAAERSHTPVYMRRTGNRWIPGADADDARSASDRTNRSHTTCNRSSVEDVLGGCPLVIIGTTSACRQWSRTVACTACSGGRSVYTRERPPVRRFAGRNRRWW